MILHNYYLSSASYRVRIALGLKGIAYEHAGVHLRRGGGEQLKEPFRKLNPEGLVPVLEDDGAVITQSLAIMEYLDEAHPQPPLLPKAPKDRARVRAIALAIACDIHPLDNLRVLRYLTSELGVAEDARNAWYRHWVETGLAALEAELAGSPLTGRFCHGDTPTLADCCLVPQIFNGRRNNCDLGRMPTLMRINDNCLALEAFQKAAPEKQPDAEA